MKKTLLFILAVCVAVCAAIYADDVQIVASTIREDGTTNTWTQTDLQAALGLVNRMYWRDQQTDAGRRRWHGEV